jgi:hypothetical protein
MTEKGKHQHCAPSLYDLEFGTAEKGKRKASTLRAYLRIVCSNLLSFVQKIDTLTRTLSYQRNYTSHVYGSVTHPSDIYFFSTKPTGDPVENLW